MQIWIWDLQQTQERTIEYSKQPPTPDRKQLLLSLTNSFPYFPIPSCFLPFTLIFPLCFIFLFFIRSLGCLGTQKIDQHYQRHSDFLFYLSYIKHGSCHQRKDVKVLKKLSLFSYLCISHNRSCRMESAEQVWIGSPCISGCHGKMTVILLVNSDKLTQFKYKLVFF